MKLKELRAVVRDVLNDKVEPFLWSDDTLNRYLNNAVREACIRARLLKDDALTNPALCQISVAAGQPMVKLRPEILVPRSGQMSNCIEKLWAVTSESMDRREPAWDSTYASPGEPKFMVMDLARGWIRLYPTPVCAGTLNLRVWRRVLDKELMIKEDDEPVINIPDVEELKHWALYEAYLMKDGESPDEERADNHLQIFESRFGSRPSLHEMARWADSPPRIRHTTMF